MASKSGERVKYEISVNVPKWLTTEKTAISNWWREGQRGNKRSSYQMPPNNLLTGTNPEEPYWHLEQVELLPDERRECKKRRKGTKDQLIKDKMVIRNWKRILKNLVMG